MKDGFIKVAAITPEVEVANVTANGEIIREHMKKASKAGARIVVFPELCITGYSCRDMFFQETLLRRAKEELLLIAEESASLRGIFFVGLPYKHRNKIYNVAAAVSEGNVLGLVPKTYLPNYHEFYEARQFTPGMDLPEVTNLTAEITTMIGSNMLFTCPEFDGLTIAAEICEDLWTPCPPSIRHAMTGATVIVNLSASNELTGKSEYRRQLVTSQSARLYCGYIYASAGSGESTQDVVYSGHDMIAENGRLLEESNLFQDGCIMSELDIQGIEKRREAMTTYEELDDSEYVISEFHLVIEDTKITRFIDPAPFVPSNPHTLEVRCEEILNIQAMGLKKRLKHTHAKTAVIGISGGLDSTLALLVTVRAFDSLGLDRKGIIAVTMPGFGTTDRTYDNAVSMIQELGCSFREISIVDSVNQHFQDIGHDDSIHDVTYENCQARERTQILMDLSNKENGMVIGTGDLSELALGWATYNGDHMSMYAVNSSVPKTLVRHLVRYYADHLTDGKLTEVLYDVLDTPVSPELLPPTEDGKIAQKTEDVVGPYELHDFYLYHLMRMGSEPGRIYRLARIAFEGVYDEETIKKWLRKFYWRFFSQQFKRSCLPDGPKVGTVSVSPRGDLRMASDTVVQIWIEEIDAL